MNTYKIVYKRGLGQEFVCEAKDEAEAAKIGLAEYRRTSGSVEILDMSPVDRVVERVELVENK